MAAIVAPGICRYTINGTYAGEEVANIIDMQIDTTATVEPREDAILTVARDVLRAWDDHIMLLISGSYLATSVSWVDLDSLDGSTGSITSAGDISWPRPGRFGGEGMPGNVSMRFDKICGGGRRARNGRTYLVGVPESVTGNPTNNDLDGPYVSDANIAGQDFLESITDNSLPTDAQRQFVVVHTVKGVYVGYDDVDEFTLGARIRTQRRRLS